MLENNEIKAGRKLVKEVWFNRKKADGFYKTMQGDLLSLNKETTRKTKKLYKHVFASLEIEGKPSRIINSVENLAKTRAMGSGLDIIQSQYRKDYSSLAIFSRREMMKVLKDRSARYNKILKSIGIKEKHGIITPEGFDMMEMIHQQGLKSINEMLTKWQSFAYNLLFEGITKSYSIPFLMDKFFTENGTIKIGSSLDGESTRDLMTSITEERTAFLRDEAKKNGWQDCWNANPLDMRTKPECLEASMAGVIPEKEMGSVYGFPPRYICRCEVVFTRREWTSLNKGVNRALEDRRVELIQELKDAPKQKASWMMITKSKEKGLREVEVVPSDPERAAGEKPYAENEERIALLEQSRVPEFEYQKGE